MSTRSSIVFGITASILTIGAVSAAPVIQPGDRVIVLGDQTAIELAGRNLFIETVEAAGATVHGMGRPGCEASGIVLPSSLEPDDIVLIGVGMIDSLRGDAHLDRFEDALGEVVASIPSDRVVLLTPIPRKARKSGFAAVNHAVVVDRFADAVARVADRHECAVVDLHDPLAYHREQSPDGSLFRDDMHLNAAGWSLAEGEVLWQLEWSQSEPGRLETAPSPMSDVGAELELQLLSGTRTLPTLPESESGLPIIVPPAEPDWNEASGMLATMNDDTDIETLRSTMRLLTNSPEHAGEARTQLDAWTTMDHPESVRLAAMAAIDDLESGASGMQTVRIGVVPVKMTYDPARFEVEAGQPVRLVLSNPDGQPHNLLVCAPGSLRAIGRASEAMGTTAEAKARDWVPDSPKVLHVMPMVQLGEEGELRFMAPERPGRYPIICTYPGHWRMMNGVMTVRRPSK